MKYDKITFAIELDDIDVSKIMNNEILVKEVRMDRPTYATFEYRKNDLIEIRTTGRKKEPVFAEIKDDPIPTYLKEHVTVNLVLHRAVLPKI